MKKINCTKNQNNFSLIAQMRHDHQVDSYHYKGVPNISSEIMGLL